MKDAIEISENGIEKAKKIARQIDVQINDFQTRSGKADPAVMYAHPRSHARSALLPD